MYRTGPSTNTVSLSMALKLNGDGRLLLEIGHPSKQGNVYTGEVTPGSRIQKFVLEQ